MEKNENSCSILRSLELDDIEEVASEAYHQEGAGRSPREPIGILARASVICAIPHSIIDTCGTKKQGFVARALSNHRALVESVN
jgi:hypothetical protein